jgi:hypothetical protein
MSSTNIVKIVIAILGLIGVLGAAYFQFVYKPNPPKDSVDYTGRVLGEDTSKPIQGAKISLEGNQPAPEILYTDSEGVFHFHVNGTPSVVRVRVEHASYQPFDRNVSLNRSGLEDIRLKPIAKEPTKSVFGFTYSSNPTIEQIRQDLQRARHIKISYGRQCPRSIGKSIVQLNGAQINASDVKQYLEQVSPRSNVKFFVTVVSEGAAYEIVCQ